MDGHARSHTILEFIEYCQQYDIILFCFLPHTTHLCQPLEGQPFLVYKQYFRQKNNQIAQRRSMIASKASFLKDMQSSRTKGYDFN